MMSTSELLESAATVMSERGHYLASRDGEFTMDTSAQRHVCLYQALAIVWCEVYGSESQDSVYWHALVRAEDALQMAGAWHRASLVDWSDHTDDEVVILTIKRAAELARAAGK